jgi:hypothetical protein
MLALACMSSFASMKKKAAVLFVGAALAAIVSLVGAGGCDETQNAWNCSDLCNRYQDCFDNNYDVNACNSRCQTLANNNQIADERANACQNCMNENSCAMATTFNCPDCAGIVP